MDHKVKDLSDLNYKMISFIDTIINSEQHSIDRGKHILLKSMFLKEFDDILNKKYEEPEEKKIKINKITKYDDYDELDIDIPKSDEEPYTEKKSDEKEHKMIGGSTNKKNSKVDFNTANNKIHNIDKNIIKKPNKKAQIERRLKRIKANDVKAIGKEFNIKPTTGKKYLTKDEVINKISRNTRLYSKVLDHIKDNYNDVITENS